MSEVPLYSNVASQNFRVGELNPLVPESSRARTYSGDTRLAFRMQGSESRVESVLSSECGTCKTVEASFWPSRPDKRHSTV